MKLRIIATTSLIALGLALANAATINITNSEPGAGHLDIDVDDLGSYGNTGGSTSDDQFEPNGSARMDPTFLTDSMIFITGHDAPNLTGAILLSSIYSYGSGSQRGLFLTVDSPNSLIAPNETESDFHIEEAEVQAIRLDFHLNQYIAPAENGVTFLRQTYTITNNGFVAVDIVFNTHWDHDMMWSGSFADDVVGAGGGQAWVFANELGSADQAIALSDGGSTVPMTFYCGARSGHEPTGGPPAFTAGTTSHVWQNFGFPDSWQNYIAFLGYNMDGDSGDNGGDGMISIEHRFTLAIGESATLVIIRTYGQAGPILPEVTVLPDSFTILRGLLLSGGLPDLFFSDDSRLVVRTAVFAPSIEPPVQIEVVGTSPTDTPSELRFQFEGMASRNLIERRISLYNYVTQSYEELHVAFAATSDEVVEIVVTSNASRFVEPGTGQVKSLMTWKAAAFSFFTGWNVGTDQTIWVITP